MAGFFRWFRRRLVPADGIIRQSNPLPRPKWRVLESVASPAMGSIYMQVLQQAGIPTLTRQDGAGAGAMGGAPTGVSVLVPAERLAEARELLDVGVATSEVEHE